ncbi:hypothetical protein [Myroides sp. N17-2]|uniref:hypothetical protein n=1 Tax=Myroides sp. N17-2 TaxID=2030799 RepID=UPI000EFD6006|nr:hypothetical protein [Myroides sp. N17-2]
MLVTRNDITFLNNLSKANDFIAIDTIPENFITEFQWYFFGKTFVEKDGELFAYPHDIKEWVRYMYAK